jgi:hypothetical protein
MAERKKDIQTTTQKLKTGEELRQDMLYPTLHRAY